MTRKSAQGEVWYSYTHGSGNEAAPVTLESDGKFRRVELRRAGCKD